MLDRLRAERAELCEGGVRVAVGPVTLLFTCATRDGSRLATCSEPELICQVEFDQDGPHAICFADEERRGLYRALRSVNGIGRASALAVLDCGEVSDTLRAVTGADNAYFRAVPGLGKTRIAAVLAELGSRYRTALPAPLSVPVGWLVEAREALASGGADAFTAELALLAALREQTPDSIEAWLDLLA
jgi:Holliday junction resolvasome RuvABC DNA-binding subunit